MIERIIEYTVMLVVFTYIKGSLPSGIFSLFIFIVGRWALNKFLNNDKRIKQLEYKVKKIENSSLQQVYLQ